MRFLKWIPILLLVAMLCGCAVSDPPVETTLPPTTQAPTTLPTPETEAPETLPPHSEFYIPDLPVEDVITYFNEVCLNAEFMDGGDPSKLQKWCNPIYYTLSGDCTDEDRQVISDFAQWLNTLEGFPGIYEAANPDQTNLHIFFRDQEGLADLMGDNFYGCDGAVTFWYDNDIIYTANVCYSTEVSQYVRNSVILEEIYNGLGPIQDTSLREDSIIFSGYSEPQALTEIDELLLRLLYHPKMECGMDLTACETIIRQLYY